MDCCCLYLSIPYLFITSIVNRWTFLPALMQSLSKPLKQDIFLEYLSSVFSSAGHVNFINITFLNSNESMTISGLCVGIQIASGNRNCWSSSTSITQSFASCKIPYLLYFFGNVLCCWPLAKVIILSLQTFLASFFDLSWPASHVQSPSIVHYDEMYISHFVIPFDNLLILGQHLLLLFCREYTQYHLQTPKKLDSVVMPMCCMLPSMRTKKDFVQVKSSNQDIFFVFSIQLQSCLVISCQIFFLDVLQVLILHFPCFSCNGGIAECFTFITGIYLGLLKL